MIYGEGWSGGGVSESSRHRGNRGNGSRRSVWVAGAGQVAHLGLLALWSDTVCAWTPVHRCPAAAVPLLTSPPCMSMRLLV